MGFIRVEDGYYTLFNIFHTYGPESQQRLFDQWRSLPPAVTQPGLVAGNFHRSLDGLSVVNYAQWESQDAYDAFIGEAGTQGRLKEALTHTRLENLACEVVHAWDPVPELSVTDPKFTVVVVVRTAPEDQPVALKEMTDDDPGLAEVPGYVSHAVHRGLSGEYVIKYAQWLDEDSYEAFGRRPRRPSPLDSLATAELYFGRLELIRSRS